MRERALFDRATKALRSYPAVVILGSRQVGKTTLAKQLAGSGKKPWVYLDLESPRDMVRLSDPESYLEDQRGKLVVIDEVQRMPELFAVLRSVIDRDRKAGRFLLLGSSSPDVVQRSSGSLAGFCSDRYRSGTVASATPSLQNPCYHCHFVRHVSDPRYEVLLHDPGATTE